MTKVGGVGITRMTANATEERFDSSHLLKCYTKFMNMTTENELKTKTRLRIDERREAVKTEFKLLRKKYKVDEFPDQRLIEVIAENKKVDARTIRRDLQSLNLI